MAITFKVPSSPDKSITQINTFLGCDFTNQPTNVDENKSPNCINMIRDVPGKVRKCMGYTLVNTFKVDGTGVPINGAFHIRKTGNMYVHAGTSLFKYDGTLVAAGLNNTRSVSLELNEKIVLIDGNGLGLLSEDSSGTPTYTRVSSSGSGYIPTVTINKDPTGGGTAYEDLNMLQSAFIETFVVTTDTASATSFQLSFSGLDATTVKVWVMNSSGDFIEKTENTDFTVDRTNGIIKFTTAPGKSPVTGEDNVKIQAYRTVENYASKINGCTFGTLFGVKGNPDRVFLSGNSSYPNYDWYSGQYDPSYFPDTGYSVLGTSASAIIGYTMVSNYLAAHKDDKEKDTNVILREGNLQDSKPVFPVVAMLQGAGALAPHSFAYLCTEPMFLTTQGIYAITAQDITGEKYSQNRSYYLDGKLLNESNLENAYGVVYNNMYWLCVNSHVYMLDGLQPMQTDKSMPYSTRQYAGFYRENVPANVMWVYNNELYFGDTSGNMFKFYTDKYALTSYNDNGAAIECQWETPDLDGKLFYKNKTFRYMAVRLDSAIATSINILSMKRGLWSLTKTDSTKGRYLMFSELVFSKFTFSCDTTPHVLHTKLRIKKVDKARFRLTNTALNEPFGLFDLALEYVESGNYKG